MGKPVRRLFAHDFFFLSRLTTPGSPRMVGKGAGEKRKFDIKQVDEIQIIIISEFPSCCVSIVDCYRIFISPLYQSIYRATYLFIYVFIHPSMCLSIIIIIIIIILLLLLLLLSSSSLCFFRSLRWVVSLLKYTIPLRSIRSVECLFLPSANIVQQSSSDIQWVEWMGTLHEPTQIQCTG